MKYGYLYSELTFVEASVFDELFPAHTGQFAAAAAAFIFAVAAARIMIGFRSRENRTKERAYRVVRFQVVSISAAYATVALVDFPSWIGKHLGITVSLFVASGVILWVVGGVTWRMQIDRLFLRSVSVPQVLLVYMVFAVSWHVFFTILSYATNEHWFAVVWELTTRDATILLLLLAALWFLAELAPIYRYFNKK